MLNLSDMSDLSELSISAIQKNREMNGRTDGRMDRPSYRHAWTHLKMRTPKVSKWRNIQIQLPTTSADEHFSRLPSPCPVYSSAPVQLSPVYTRVVGHGPFVILVITIQRKTLCSAQIALYSARYTHTRLFSLAFCHFSLLR